MRGGSRRVTFRCDHDVSAKLRRFWHAISSSRALIRERCVALEQTLVSSPGAAFDVRLRRRPRRRNDIPIKRKLSERGMGGIKSDMRLAHARAGVIARA